ncbi:MAG: GAF domain-containing protein [Anaerolineales bacterium]
MLNMTKPIKPMSIQLRETSQLTGAYWAIWLERSSDWEFLAEYKLNLKNRTTILQYIHIQAVKGWLNGAIAGGRSRSRSVLRSIGLPGAKIYIFPDQMTQRVIIVGADALSEMAQRFWRVVALGNSSRSVLDQATPPVLPKPNLGIPYYVPEALDRVLKMVLKTADCDHGWLAILKGNYFEIKSCANCANNLEKRISIGANPLLSEINQTLQERLVEKGDPDWAMIPSTGITKTARTWAALPLVIGTRLIGLVALWKGEVVSQDEWSAIKQIAKQVSPSVEASVTFSDLTNHLGRMALLNDFAATITSAFDQEQIAQRLFALLQRSFGTERISLVVLSPDGNGLQKFTNRDGTIVKQTMSIDDGSVPSTIGRGDVQRVDSITAESDISPVYPGSHSALIIPMKYQRKLIGTLGLESVEENAYTVYDEHLLMVIASHLASLLENGRLRREAEDHGRNLSLIHEVIEQVIGLSDLREISQIASELMARSFAYELAEIALIEGPERNLAITGIGGNAGELVQQGLNYMDEVRRDEIVMRVISTGQNILVNDSSHNPLFRPAPNWETRSEMCVALKDSDQIIGVINVKSQQRNAFSQNDFIVLETLAGILSSMISSAGQYQKLQATVDQLEAAREELQERVAAQRMAESRLVQAAKLAAVGEMAAGIAHELNNPLTTVSGFTELVLEELPDGSGIRNDLELVLREAQRARGVVRRLLDFARQSENARARSDLNEIIMDVLALVNHLLRMSGIQLFTDLTDGIPWISVDRNQIKQVLLNLVHNALHAMPTGGELHISTSLKQRNQHEWLAISLTDTGTGISPENLERVFEPFFTTRSKDGGTGLGLSVTYGIITDHGGSIDVESQVGKGSTFTVWFPVEAE